MGFGRKNEPNKKLYFCFDGISIQNRRPTNMDSLIVLEKLIGSDSLVLAAVSDGVGSLEQGAFAATALIRGLLGWFSTLETTTEIVEALCAEIRSINKEVYDQSQEYCFKSAATVTILLIVNHVFYTFNAGDSRIYSYQDGRLEQLTKDDISATGALTEYLGFRIPPRLSISQGDARAKTFLICSDGLYRKMDLEILSEKLERCNRTNIHRCLEELVDYAARQGETDNISIAIIKDCTKG